MKMTLRVNGRLHRVDVDPQKPLLWVLREDIGLNGTKYSCGIGICGCCSVLVDGAAVHSCVVAVGSVGNSEVITIEGLNSDVGIAVKEAWIAEQVPQCGYCHPGQIIKASYLLSQNPEPTDADIDETMTNLCRCGTYQRIRGGIKRAAANIKEQK
jgi:aerobic-type carbon monoxide dehydrogenase small subunit (CoxS/CutS family)